MCGLYVWASLSAGVGAAGFGRVGFCVCHFCFVTQSSDKKIPRQWLIPIGGGFFPMIVILPKYFGPGCGS